MIELKDVFKAFARNKVLTGVSGNFKMGKISIVLGQSGEGKSILMKTIVGLERIDRGRILFDTEDISHLSENGFMKIRRKCCYNFQLPGLLRAKTVFHNVALPLIWEGRWVRGFRDIVFEALEKVGLVGVSESYPAELSYGMQKRVSFARSLVMDPDYIIFDEPTTGLDPITSLKLYDLIRVFVDRYGKGAIVVTHDVNGVAYLGGDVNLLAGGKFIFRGTANDFFVTRNPDVETFLEGRG